MKGDSITYFDMKCRKALSLLCPRSKFVESATGERHANALALLEAGNSKPRFLESPVFRTPERPVEIRVRLKPKVRTRSRPAASTPRNETPKILREAPFVQVDRPRPIYVCRSSK
jgi:hypothetical protein